MCQEAVRRLCNPSESRHVRKVARLLARPLSRGSLDGHWLPPAWHPRRDRGQRVLLRRRSHRYGSRALLAPGALGPCSLLPTCSSFSYPLRTLVGQTLPPDEYDASYRSAAHALPTGELRGEPLPRTWVHRAPQGTTDSFACHHGGESSQVYPTCREDRS